MSYDWRYKQTNRDYNFTYLDTAYYETKTLYFNVFRTPFVPNSSIYGSCATYRAQDITLLQLNMSMPRFISRSPAYIGSSHGEEIALIDLSSLTSCPITSMVTVPAEELVLLIQL